MRLAHQPRRAAMLVGSKPIENHLMNTLKNTLLALPLLLAANFALAHGDGFACKEPTKEWKQREELQSKLKAEGWNVRKLKVENGCYEVYGFDNKGKKREAYFNPRTLEPVSAQAQK